MVGSQAEYLYRKVGCQDELYLNRGGSELLIVVKIEDQVSALRRKGTGETG